VGSSELGELGTDAADFSRMMLKADG